MANNRIYYAIQQVQLGPAASTQFPIHGLQTLGVTTNFNLEQVFEIGQLAIYQNVEEVPDIEVTLNKVLDGYPLIYTLATETGSSIGTGLVAANPTIPGRQNARTDMRLSIFPDTNISASGTSFTDLVCSGMYVSSVSYTFPVDGNFTEDVTLVGNNKVWTGTSTGSFTNNDEPLSDSGVGRRKYLNMANCRFPTQIPGITSSGTNPAIGNGSGFAAHFQNITVSCDFGREPINELGTYAPYHRFVTFPVEATCEFEVVAITGDMINATEDGYYEGLTGTTVAGPNTPQCSGRHNLVDETIFIESCEGTRIFLGTKNKLTSVNYTGGDTGGGNVSVTYSYTTFNDFVVAHSGGLFYSQLDNSTFTPA
jgi:hypothetical protein